MPHAKHRLLLVEDDADIARELQWRMSAQGWNVDHAATLREADVLVAPEVHELVVLDLGLPDGSGLDWLRALRRRDPHMPVLVLTARDSVAERVLGLQSGADDYLGKPFAVEELDARIAVLVRRHRRDRGDVLTLGPLVWAGQQGHATCHGEPLELHPREFEVLGLLLARTPRLLPKRTLVEALAERNMELSDSAAEVYISRLRRKLAGCGCTIQTMRGFGYRIVADGVVDAS